MYWLEVSVITDGEGAEAVAEYLRPFAYSEGVALEQLGDMASPDANALEAAVTVKIYLPESDDTPARRRLIEDRVHQLGRLYPIPPPTFRKLREEDWANAWKAHYRPFRVGQRIWIQPSWLDEAEMALAGETESGDVILTLDPGMAFGTGLHPTTQMCLRALETYVTADSALLDVGTGSGILAIAAAKLGAAHILGIDIDDIAVRTARENAEINRVENFEARQGVLADMPVEPWPVVVVNILAPVIVNLLRTDALLSYVAEGGVLILSGIIEEQAEMVSTAVNDAGGRLGETLQVRDWLTLIVTK